jgi:hypothetical protein
MSNSHYYSREHGHVIKRGQRNPERKSGSDSGRKQRQRDQAAGTYPRPGLPIARQDKSVLWIEGYQESYYQPKASGGQMLGDEPRVSINITIDRTLLETIDSQDMPRSQVVEAALKRFINRNKQVLRLMNYP